MPKILYQLIPATLALLALPLAGQAQANFRPGYIIALKGDTLRGSLDYGSGSRSAYECRFKPDNAAAVDKYVPSQLLGYGFAHDRFYQSRRVPAQNPAADTTSQQLFLEVLVQGPASLYALSDNSSGRRYYLRVGNGPVLPLVQLSEIVTVNGSQFKRENPLYRKTLADAFTACPAMRGKMSDVSFASTSFIRIVQQYNTCMGGGQTVSEMAAPKRRSYFLLEAVAGAQASNLRFSGEISVKDVAIGGGTRPVVGLALQQYLPVWANRFGVRLEVLYQPQQYGNQEFYSPSAYAYAAYQEVRVKFDQLRVPVLFRYMPLNGRFQPFIEAGASIALALTNSNEYRYRAQPTSAYSPWSPILSPRGVEEGVLAGVGASMLLPNKRHLTAELRAERTNGFSEAVGVSTTINRGYFLLSYDLSKPRPSN